MRRARHLLGKLARYVRVIGVCEAVEGVEDGLQHVVNVRLLNVLPSRPLLGVALGQLAGDGDRYGNGTGEPSPLLADLLAPRLADALLEHARLARRVDAGVAAAHRSPRALLPNDLGKLRDGVSLASDARAPAHLRTAVVYWSASLLATRMRMSGSCSMAMRARYGAKWLGSSMPKLMRMP